MGGVVRSFKRASCAGVLACSLALAPLHGAARPLGVVLWAQRAHVGSAAVNPGTTVFPGDRLWTDADGTLRLRAGLSQIYLLPSSAANLGSDPEKLTCAVTRGTVEFFSSDSEQIAVLAAGIAVRPRKSGPAHGRIMLVSADELRVTSYKGVLEVVTESGVFPVPEGSTYRIQLRDSGSGPEGAGAEAARRAQFVEWVAGGTIAAAIIAVVIWRNTISPTSP